MIREVIMYTVVCDRCGTSADEGTDYSAWTCQDGARLTAEGNDYMVIEGKDYCPDCVTLDEESDEYKPKTTGEA